MKNPNGYGSVVKLSGNRRKPYCARKTVGWTEKGYPKYSIIGYYAERSEALIALAEYNKNPYDIDYGKLTTKDIFDKWSERDFPKMSNSYVAASKTAYKHIKSLYDMEYKSLKAYQMQECIDNCGCGYSTQGAIRNLFVQLDKYALELDIITKSNAALITTAPITPGEKMPFSEEEIETLWNAYDEKWVDSVIFLLYTGFRINEFLTIETKNVDLEEMVIKGGIKTKAGKDRVVPIHPRIVQIVQNRLNPQHEFLFSHENGKKIINVSYYSYWNEIMKKFNMDHTPHECRHTFRSRLDSAGANKKCIDMIMGHASKDIGERVYTHKTLDELKEAVNLLK